MPKGIYIRTSNVAWFKKGELSRTIGEANGEWKGDKASYGAIHHWLYKHFGQPSLCEKCGTTKSKKFEWANISKTYKRERSDWMRLCASCHDKYDDMGTIRRKLSTLMWETRRMLHG